MVWEEVTRTSIPASKAIDIKKHKGKTLQGYYTGKREFTTRIGKQVVYNFEDDGEGFSIFGFTNLNRAMEKIKHGTEVRITYLGMENIQTRFGMKNVHQVRIEVNRESTSHNDEEAF